MANHIRYVRRRSNGVYYYERRVPQAVIDRPADWERYFKAQRLFRRSLQTKRQIDAFRMAEQAHREFDELVAKALGRSLPRDGLPGDRNTRPLTPSIIARVSVSNSATAPRMPRISFPIEEVVSTAPCCTHRNPTCLADSCAMMSCRSRPDRARRSRRVTTKVSPSRTQSRQSASAWRSLRDVPVTFSAKIFSHPAWASCSS